MSSPDDTQDTLRRSERIAQDKNTVDCYKEYNNTGNKHSALVNEAESAASNQSEIMSSKSELHIQHETLLQDIQDYIDENAIDDMIVVQDIDIYVTRLEQLRTQFRSLHKSLACVAKESYEQVYRNLNDNIILMLKEKILVAKAKRSRIRSHDDDNVREEKMMQLKKAAEESLQKQRTAEFLVAEINRYMTELEKGFLADLDEVTDDELMRRKKQLSSCSESVDKISKKYHQLIEITPEDDMKVDINRNISIRYEKLIITKETYVSNIENKVELRELKKEKHFQVSSLNINLPRFKGYESAYDIYSFQYEFEKLHLKGTPRKVLSDLLKNNYLEGPALTLVWRLDNIDEIWSRLKKSYGDPKTMLKKRLSEVQRIGPIWKIRDIEGLKEGLITIVNAMSDLKKLAEKHNIENTLYYGEAIHMIYSIMGDFRLTKWISIVTEHKWDEKQVWSKLIEYLEKELVIQQEKALINRSCASLLNKDAATSEKPKSVHFEQSYLMAHNDDKDIENQCHICGECNHTETNGPYGRKLVQYFSCQKFVEMSPNQRFIKLRENGLCFQCLYPGALQNQGKHRVGGCQLDFSCKHLSHNKYPVRKHVLVCQEHSENEDNKVLLEDYKKRCILKPGVAEFSKNIKLSFHAVAPLIKSVNNDVSVLSDPTLDCITDSAIYMFQTIEVDGDTFTLFFDSGCSDLVSRFTAVKSIGARAVQELKGPITLGGVGSLHTESPYGIYKVELPLSNGRNAVMSGVCLEKVTNTFPVYPLRGRVKTDIEHAYRLNGGNTDDLPSLPEFVGGDVDFLVGAKYLRYFPEPLFTLPSGLTIYRSPFVSADGSCGVIGGPHAVFTEINRLHYNGNICQKIYLSEQCRIYSKGFLINPDEYYLDVKIPKDFKHDLLTENPSNRNKNQEEYLVASRSIARFDEVENAGSDILYRCIDCRKCQSCRNGEKIEMISIKEEVEQDLINKSVHIDFNTGVIVAQLPLLDDPVKKLAPNKKNALAVFNSQVKKLSRCHQDKEDVIKSERKLQEMDYVDYVKNLTLDQQEKLRNNPIQNFIPWRAVWNRNSYSTPCRMVFDASQPTASSVSLNDIVAKGRNNMNKLVEIMIRWTIYPIAFHTDVQKMYNSVKLVESHWCLQRYVWQKDLDQTSIPEEKIIKTLIYGVKSSGNQAERGLRETASAFKEKYPQVDKVIQKDVYVDDCISGEFSKDAAYNIADELMIVLKRGGFNLKGFTFSGLLPPDQLTEDGLSIKVAGCKWYSKEDELQLDIGELNFNKKVRGKKLIDGDNVIPEALTRRHCASKVAEVFDLTGRITPITAHMKLDLHVLIERGLGWDDQLPNDLREVWQSHFQMMRQLKSVRFKRAIIPENAVSLDINTIDAGDSSGNICCSAVYARFKLKDANYSSQLVFSRSKMVPKGLSQPRAELLAATLNTHTGEVVRRSFQDYHKKSIKITDSQIVMHWLNNKELPLKQWVRNRVVEITRFTKPAEWYFVQSSDMIADLATRRGAKIDDVGPTSLWQEGFPWMRLEETEFPMKSVAEIKLSNTEVESVQKELLSEKHKVNSLTRFDWPQDSNPVAAYVSESGRSAVPNQIKSRYKFSNYILDPNRHRFTTVVRIIALVQKFIRNMKYQIEEKRKTVQVNTELRCRVKKDEVISLDSEIKVILSDSEIEEAENYFYRIATLEVKQFVKESTYKHLSTEKDSILRYTGRILPMQKFNSIMTLTDIMRDLTATTFCVPIIERYSPLAYSIVNEVHWHNELAKHAGVETVLRYTMQYAYILDGRELVKQFRKMCERCRYLAKRTIDIAMGPVSSYNLTIAPAFFITQLDLAGPLIAYSAHNKRTTIKVYFVVFCCTTTSTVNIKVMDAYSAPVFINSFIRFSCEVGYPKVLLIDEGSQLINGCENMKLNFQDVKSQLNQQKRIEFETCPVGGHNMHGRVERRIKHIKESVNKTLHNERLSILEWETLGAEISNTINDLPLAIGSVVSELENIDLITPNRLRLGRNNQRSPVGPLEVTENVDKFLKFNEQIYNLWFEAWLVSCVPKLMRQPKWFRSDEDIKVGDIVLFLKKEGNISGNYQYGMINDVKSGVDGKVHRVTVKYRNHTENKDRETYRAVRQLVVIHRVDELGIMRELGEIASAADVKKILTNGHQE